MSYYFLYSFPTLFQFDLFFLNFVLLKSKNAQKADKTLIRCL